jgi:RNA polymerase sigma-70 factor (ECF subfamily)
VRPEPHCQVTVDSTQRLHSVPSAKPNRQASAQLVALPLPPIEDSELVAGLRTQRPASVAELLSRYTDLVRHFLVRTLGSSHDVEDLTQETFLTVIRRVRTLRNPAALRSFVVSVAIRIARNELRKRSLRRFVGFDTTTEVPVALPHDVTVTEGVRHLYRALDRLDAECRLAFVLRHVEGYELLEVADACGCSLATIKRRLTRAEKRFVAISQGDAVLREFLAAEEGGLR